MKAREGKMGRGEIRGEQERGQGKAREWKDEGRARDGEREIKEKQEMGRRGREGRC